MTALRALTIRLADLFNVLDESLAQVPEEHKGPAVSRFCSLLQAKHDVKQVDLEEGVRMLALKEDYLNGLVSISSGGIVRRKEAVASRTVPVSKSEEMGKNGLMWVDKR